jgi:hypothetical protein
MPLVLAAAGVEVPPPNEAAERARKIKPEYARGPLVRVAGGRNQAEAELIQNLLLEEGVPSMLRRSAGFDVPDFLAAGPRDVYVPESGAEAARDTLFEADMLPPEAPPRDARDVRSLALKLSLAVLAGGGVTALIAYVLVHLGD